MDKPVRWGQVCGEFCQVARSVRAAYALLFNNYTSSNTLLIGEFNAILSRALDQHNMIPTKRKIYTFLT